MNQSSFHGYIAQTSPILFQLVTFQIFHLGRPHLNIAALPSSPPILKLVSPPFAHIANPQQICPHLSMSVSFTIGLVLGPLVLLPQLAQAATRVRLVVRLLVSSPEMNLLRPRPLLPPLVSYHLMGRSLDPHSSAPRFSRMISSSAVPTQKITYLAFLLLNYHHSW